MERGEERPVEAVPEDPTVEADQADPATPGPGDSEGARPEPDPPGEGER